MWCVDSSGSKELCTRWHPAGSNGGKRAICFVGGAPLRCGLSSKSLTTCCKGKGSPYSIAERRVPELIPVLGSQSAGDVSHKPGGRLPLLSARPAVTPATLKRAATNFGAW